MRSHDIRVLAQVMAAKRSSHVKTEHGAKKKMKVEEPEAASHHLMFSCTPISVRMCFASRNRPFPLVPFLFPSSHLLTAIRCASSPRIFMCIIPIAHEFASGGLAVHGAESGRGHRCFRRHDHEEMRELAREDIMHR